MEDTAKKIWKNNYWYTTKALRFRHTPVEWTITGCSLLSRADITPSKWALTTLGKSASRGCFWHVTNFVEQQRAEQQTCSYITLSKF